MSALRPDQVRKLVVHQPTCTVSPRPNDGSQCRLTANMRISRIPTRKGGSETPNRDTACNRRLDQ
jgi:hypothetical protein